MKLCVACEGGSAVAPAPKDAPAPRIKTIFLPVEALRYRPRRLTFRMSAAGSHACTWHCIDHTALDGVKTGKARDLLKLKNGVHLLLDVDCGGH